MATETSESDDDVDYFRTTIECRRENGAWKATEPAGGSDLFGRGDNPREAVANYLEVLG